MGVPCQHTHVGAKGQGGAGRIWAVMKVVDPTGSFGDGMDDPVSK